MCDWKDENKFKKEAGVGLFKKNKRYNTTALVVNIKHNNSDKSNNLRISGYNCGTTGDMFIYL